MSEKQVVDVKGVIEDKAIKEDKKGRQYFEFKIEGKTWRWFTHSDEAAKLTAQTIKKGDYVEGIGELQDSTFNGNPTLFRNIKSLELKIGEIQSTIPSTETAHPRERHGAETGLACNQALRLMISHYNQPLQDAIKITHEGKILKQDEMLVGLRKIYQEWVRFFLESNDGVRND